MVYLSRMQAQRLGGFLFAAFLAGSTAACAGGSAMVYPAQAGVPGEGPFPSPAPQPVATPPPDGDRLVVTPVFYVPSDVLLDPQTETRMTELITAHLALARARYSKILVVDTFEYAIEQPVTYHSPLTTAQLEASQPDTAHQMTRELLAWRHEDRHTSRHVFVTLLVRSPDRPCGRAHIRCMGGARTFNGAPGTGGGFVQMEANNLLDGKHFQSTLIHELGHAFGLSHVDCRGESMTASGSIMSYNPSHHSEGLQESYDPGGLTPEELLTLSRNRLAFPRLGLHPSMREIAAQRLNKANGECYLGPMDGSIGGLERAGYELFYDGRRVSGPDARYYTREKAQANCAGVMRAYPQIRITCRYDGVVFGGNDPQRR